MRTGEPQMPPGAAPPAWLTKPARLVWDRLAPALEDARILTRADAVALGNLCELQARFTAEARRPGGTPSARLAAEIRQHLGRFGLTPADRARVVVAPPEAPDPFAAFDGLTVLPGGRRDPT